MSIFLIFPIALALTACGASKSGSSGAGVSSYNHIIRTPQVKCGSKDCLTGEAVSLTSSLKSGSQFMALSVGGEFNGFKTDYAQIKTALSRIQEEVENFNRFASDEELSSCDDIPTTGSFTVPGQKVTVLTFSTGDESFDLGEGLVAMEKKISITTDGDPLMLLQVACDGTTQTVHILNSGVNTNNGVDEKVLFEAFYQTDSSTGKVNLQFAEIMGTVYRTMASFKTSGGIDFNISGFTKNGTGGSSSYSSFSAMGFDDASSFPIGALEMVYSTTQGASLNGINFGSITGQERVCAYGYSSTPSFDDTESCYADTTKSALVPVVPPMLGDGGSPAWNTTYLEAINITDINL